MGAEEFLNIEEEHKREFSELLQYCLASGRIDQNLYQEYDVKRGLRDSSGKGVLTGLTEISDVVGYTYEDGRKIPADGQLFFQGYNVADMVASLEKRKKGFEEVIYTLLFGRIPNARQSAMFNDLLSDMMNLNNRFIRDVVMKASNENIMNAMQRASIMHAFESVTKLGGYIILFSILASLVVHLTAPVPVLSLFLTGFTEMTTGIALVGASSMHLPLRYLLSLTFASFGGLSCIAQTRGMLCGTPLSIRTYIAGKTVHGICTLLVGWLLLFVQTFQ